MWYISTLSKQNVKINQGFINVEDILGLGLARRKIGHIFLFL